MRMADPSPCGDTSFRAMVRAICDADPANVRDGGCVESVLTVLTQRRRVRFFWHRRNTADLEVGRNAADLKVRTTSSHDVPEGPSAPARVLPIAGAPVQPSPADNLPRSARESCRSRREDSAA